MPRSTPMWLRITILVLLIAVFTVAFVAATYAIIHAWAASNL